VRTLFPTAPDAEVTIEANPETVDPDRLAAFRAAGVNRVSFGAQSFRPHVLQRLGRAHTAGRTVEAVHEARAAGFDNLNLDLIYGTPGETLDDWRMTLEAAIALGPEHLSAYALTIEPGTAFGADVASGAMPAPDDDDQADKYELALDLLAAAGYEHYEISNWAKAGRACRHNLVYWTQGDYLGLGLGAHSHRAGRRWWNTRSLTSYLADPAGARAGSEHLTPQARADEWITLRLRLIEGIDLDEARARTGRDLSEDTRALEAAGLVEIRGARMVLTPRGMLLENEVALRLTG
jgi:oxygen-independent coproporphyrinogen-3 oxidase